MVIFFIILGATLILVGVLWLIIFNINKSKIFESFTTGKLTEYQDDELVPEEVAKQFMSDVIEIAFRKTLINILVPAIIIICGVIILLIVFKSVK